MENLWEKSGLRVFKSFQTKTVMHRYQDKCQPLSLCFFRLATSENFHWISCWILSETFKVFRHPPSSKVQIKSAVLKKKIGGQTVNSCVQWATENWCVSFYLTALTERQLQLTCFEKPKLPYPLRRYLLTQHCKTWRECRWLTHGGCSRETTKLDIYPN